MEEPHGCLVLWIPSLLHSDLWTQEMVFPLQHFTHKVVIELSQFQA